jgi:hypothetical protein
VNMKETRCQWRIVALTGLVNPPRCSSPSVRLATQNAVCQISPLLWCLGATDHGRTGTLGIVEELERVAEISQQTYHSRWRPWCQGLIVSLATGRLVDSGVFGACHRCPAMLPVHSRMEVQ